MVFHLVVEVVEVAVEPHLLVLHQEVFLQVLLQKVEQ
jgi:hypothetical protein